MPEEYEEEVMASFNKMKAEGSLSLYLVNPTRGRLKKACKEAYPKRVTSFHEAEMFKELLEEYPNEENYWRIIDRSDADKFRPLDNFLKGEIEAPNIKTIDLLAWLIDFPARPYVRWLIKDDTIIKTYESSDQEEIITENAVPNVKGKGFVAKHFTKARRRATLVILTILVIAFGVTLITLKNISNQCMYWSGDRYVPVNCDKIIYNRQHQKIIPIAIDTAKVNHFKMINDLNRITLGNLKNIWCIKIGSKYEFYTSEGHHPLTGNPLKKTSSYIYKNHIVPNKKHK